MDGSRFDALARKAGTLSDRRIALRTALAGVAASGLAATRLGLSHGAVEAKKKKKCKKCKAKRLGESCTSHKQCCTNQTNLACQVQFGAGNSDRTCCGVLDAPCDQPEDCCQQYDCVAGACAPVEIV